MEETTDSKISDLYAIHLRDGTFGWLLQRVLAPLPAKPVAVGAKWKTKAPESMPGFGKLRGDTETTLGKEAKVSDVVCRELTVKGSHSLEVDMKLINASLTGTLRPKDVREGTVRPAGGVDASRRAEVELGGDQKWPWRQSNRAEGDVQASPRAGASRERDRRLRSAAISPAYCSSTLATSSRP
jgi:hypothetical protein